jgi:hypothetical protein
MIKSKRMRWAGHTADTGEKGNAYRIFMVKPERRPLGRAIHWPKDIKMDLKEIQDRAVWNGLE